MRKLIVLCSFLIVMSGWKTDVLAQETANPPESARSAEMPVHFYHLEFVVQELGTDGKPVNGRIYTVDTNTDRSNRGVSIRTGSRIPIATSGQSYQYVDLGINFDVHNTREVGGKLALEVTADVSSLATPGGISQPSTPVIRTNKWQSPILVPLNKPTIVFTSDSLDSKGNMQIQLTAKPVM